MNEWEVQMVNDALMNDPRQERVRADAAVTMGADVDTDAVRDETARRQRENSDNTPLSESEANQPFYINVQEDPKIRTTRKLGGNFSAPEGQQNLASEQFSKLQKQNTEMQNKTPGWWDYMKQTSGGKAGAIARIADNAVRDLGARVSRAAAGGSGGQYGNANAQGANDAFGMESYGQMQQDFIKKDQALAESEAKIGQEINSMIDKLPIEDYQNMQALNNQLATLREAGRISAETQKEIIKATIDGDIQRLHEINDEVTFLEAGKGAMLTNPLGTIQTGQTLVIELIKALKGLSDGGFTGQGGKYEPKGIVHGGEYVIPKEDVDQQTGKPKREFMLKMLKGYAKGGYVGGRKTSQDKLNDLNNWSRLEKKRIAEQTARHKQHQKEVYAKSWTLLTDDELDDLEKNNPKKYDKIMKEYQNRQAG